MSVVIAVVEGGDYWSRMFSGVVKLNFEHGT